MEARNIRVSPVESSRYKPKRRLRTAKVFAQTAQLDLFEIKQGLRPLHRRSLLRLQAQFGQQPPLLYRASQPIGLLSDMDFFFFINATEKIDQRADEEHHGTSNRPPHVSSIIPGVVDE
jgi:hypothetical protein